MNELRSAMQLADVNGVQPIADTPAELGDFNGPEDLIKSKTYYLLTEAKYLELLKSKDD